MKATNTYSYKLAIVATSFVMVYFVSGIASIAQATELLKAAPIQQVDLIKDAKESLKLSFSTLMINDNFNQNHTDSMIAKTKDTANKNNPVTLTKATLISE